MSLNVRHKHSSVQGQAPQASDLVNGEIALNINANSTALYTKDSAGNVVKLAPTDVPVDSVFGRTGAVVAANGDYDLGELGDVDLTSSAPTSGQFLKYDGANWVPGSVVSSVDLGYTAAASSGTVTNTAGTDATIPGFTSTNAGLVGGSGGGTANYLRADGTWAAPPGDATDLGYTASATNGTVTSSTGTDATVPLVTGTNAGLMAPNDKTKLDGIQTGAEVNAVDSVFGRTGAVVATEGDYSLDQLGDVDLTTTPPTTGQILTYDGAGWVADDVSVPDPLTLNNLTVNTLLTADHIHGNLAGSVYIHVKNTDSVQLDAGTPFYITGTVGASDRVEIQAADSSDPAKGPAVGLLETTLAVNGEGNGTIIGEIFNFDTSTPGWSTNDELYVANGGGLTNLQPTSGYRQIVAYVGRIQASTGTLILTGTSIDPVAGSNGQIQFNDDGGFGGDAGLTWDKSTDLLSVGGNIQLSATGSAATTDTGIYSPGADQLAISTGGTGRLFVDASGYIGNKANPFADLDVDGARGIYSRGSSQGLIALDDKGVADNSTPIRWMSSDGGSHIFYAGNRNASGGTTNSTEHLRITSAGNVGIGTSSPGAQLDILSSGFSNLRVRSSATNSATINLSNSDRNYSFNTNSGNFYIRDESVPSERLRITAAGLVGIGTSSPGAALDVRARDLHLGALSGGAGLITFRRDSGAQSGYFGWDAGSNTVMRWGNDSGSGRLAFNTNGTEKARIDENGRLGIGTSSPSRQLEVASTNTQIRITDTDNASSGNCTLEFAFSGGRNGYVGYGGSNALYLWNELNNSLILGTNSQEAVRIDSFGRLLVGTSGTRAIEPYRNTTAGIVSQVLFENANAALTIVSTDNSNSAYGASLYLARTRGSANQPVVSGDALGGISFAGGDNTDIRTRGASIDCEVDGTPGANDMPGRLVFSTTADGDAIPTERMRITSDGTVIIDSNGTAFDSAAMLVDAASLAKNGVSIRTDAVNAGFILGSAGISNTCTAALFKTNFGNVGSITCGSTTSFNTSSDYRLKENVIPVTDGITRLQQLKPSRFNFIADPDKTVDGFLAHEVQAIVPEAITGEKDAVDDEGNPEYQGIDQSKLVPLLTAALQEAIGEIKSLKARVAVLETP